MKLESEFEDDMNCFDITWVATHPNTPLKDCVYIGGEENGAWWGGGELSNGGYPLHQSNPISSSPLITGEIDSYTWGHVLRNSFISSKGVLINLSPNMLANVSINSEKENYMCFSVGSSLDSEPAVLNYSICTAENISTLHHYINSKNIYYDDLKNMFSDNEDAEFPDEMGEIILSQVADRIQHPVWRPWISSADGVLTQDFVLNYVEEIINKKMGQWGHILLPTSWQEKCGSLSFDLERFPDPAFMAETLTRQGFRLALSINPMVDSDSVTFKNGTAAGLWVRQYHSSLPVLTRTKDVLAAAIIDFTNPRSFDWFSNKLKLLDERYTIDRFHLVPTSAHDLPQFHEFHEPITNPDQTLDMFLDAVSRFSHPISTEVSINVPVPPTFITISSSEGEWKALETMVHRVITLSMLGMPFIDTGIIGGGKCKPGYIPDQELYIRWLQVAAFLPAVQMCVLPHAYSQNIEAIALDFSKKRKMHVLGRFEKEYKNAMLKGKPLITPLALMYPDDEEAIKINDQWLIGDNLLVAPILKQGHRARDVYLPEGLWKDMTDNHIKGGKAWHHGLRVPLTDIGLFRLLKVEGYTDDKIVNN